MATLTNFQAILALSGGGGATGLPSELAVDNTTGGNDIVFSASTGDGIATESNGAGAGYTLDITGSDAGGGLFAGGDIDLTPGLGSGGGPNGVINLNGDVNVTGTLSLSNLISGTGSPEGASAAGVSTIYQRTDGAGGNSLYVKMSGAGVTGWCPMGPKVCETFTSTGSANFDTSRNGFDDTVPLNVEAITVYWNGVLQREGGTDDYTVAFDTPIVGQMRITFTTAPPNGDLVTICYLPE